MSTKALSRGSKTTLPRLGDVVGEVATLAPDRELVDPAVVEAAARGWSANTIRAFLSDIRLWD